MPTEYPRRQFEHNGGQITICCRPWPGDEWWCIQFIGRGVPEDVRLKQEEYTAEEALDKAVGVFERAQVARKE